jgi:hypothetical protein
VCDWVPFDPDASDTWCWKTLQAMSIADEYFSLRFEGSGVLKQTTCSDLR